MKLGVAMTAMLKAPADQAADLYLDVNRKANQYVRVERSSRVERSLPCCHGVRKLHSEPVIVWT